MLPYASGPAVVNSPPGNINDNVFDPVLPLLQPLRHAYDGNGVVLVAGASIASAPPNHQARSPPAEYDGFSPLRSVVRGSNDVSFAHVSAGQVKAERRVDVLLQE